MLKYIISVSAIIICCSELSIADIIHIPDDRETIQAGIDVAFSGDTVLVQPGDYIENIRFRDRDDIVLGSLFLITGDPEHIESTIIDGNSNGSSVISFGNNNRIESARIVGFSITGGLTDYGGGIYISGDRCVVTLQHLIITQNAAEINGGGIHVTRDATATISSVVIENNEARQGGGISIFNDARVHISNSVIANNNSAWDAGGVKCSQHSESVMVNVKVINNESRYSAGIFVNENASLNFADGVIANNVNRNSHAIAIGGLRAIIELRSIAIYGNTSTADGSNVIRLELGQAHLENLTIVNNIDGITDAISARGCDLFVVNSIIRDHDGVEVNSTEGDVEIGYCDISGGEDGIDAENLDWGEGNIDEDPLFEDPDENDYYLTIDSPCIDTGDPEANLNSDGTRADMGAYAYLRGGVINGYVFDFRTEQPLEGAVVTTSYGAEAITDEDGFWHIDQLRLTPYDITAGMTGYIDSTMLDVQVDIEDTLSIEFDLLFAELEPSIEEVGTELEIGENESFDFSIRNSGNAVLDWSAKTRYRGDAGLDPWELRQVIQFDDNMDVTGLNSVAFIDSLFFIVGTIDYNRTIFILNREGNLVSLFDLAIEGNRTMKDLAYDGEHIWGGIDGTVYGMSIEGEIISTFPSGFEQINAITWDIENELLWISDSESNPVGFNLEGKQIEGMDVDCGGVQIYGLSYFPEDLNDAPLYILYQEQDGDSQTVMKHNFETEENTIVTQLEPEAGRYPICSFIADGLDDYSWIYISTTRIRGDRDRVDVWQLYTNTSWSILDPNEGNLNPEANQDLTLLLDATDLTPIEHLAELTFTHNGFGLETTIPINLTVTNFENIHEDENKLPVRFTISAAYPNPFNSMVRLNYSVPQLSQVSIKLYDVTGSLVGEVADGIHETGQHTVVWDALNMPSGLYFARMEAGDFAQAVKLSVIN